MKIIGVYNIKGGVGKTATSVNVAWMASNHGLRTLVWDLDPQGAASFYFRIKPKLDARSRSLLKGKEDLEDLIKGTDYDLLDLLPADFSYRHMDLMLEDAGHPTKQLERILEPLKSSYDLIILDCPPSISLVSENVFRAADLLLVPMIPTTLSVRTLQQLRDFLREHRRTLGVDLLPFFSMVDRRKRMHLEIISSLPESFPELLSTQIPYSSDIERMGEYRTPLAEYAPKGPAMQAYDALWQEVCSRL